MDLLRELEVSTNKSTARKSYALFILYRETTTKNLTLLGSKY
jgi:hypothetical protein